MARQSRRKGNAKSSRTRPRTASAGTRAAEHRTAERVLPDAIPLVAGEPGVSVAGGDVDAEEARAATIGEEAVGGSVATPDKDVVDDLGRAVGVDLAPTAPVITSEEILRERDARYWDLEWRARKREGEP